MPELFHDGSVSKILECSKIAGEYAVRGEFTDIHCVDAAGEGLSHLQVALRDHDHGPQPVGDCPDDLCLVGERILALCDEHASLPVGADEAGLDPATLALLLQLGSMLYELYRKWRS